MVYIGRLGKWGRFPIFLCLIRQHNTGFKVGFIKSCIKSSCGLDMRWPAVPQGLI